MQKTIRTDQTFEDYFLKNWNEYAIKKGKHLCLGHYHIERYFENFSLLPSTGYNNFFAHYGDIVILPDMHIGLEETNENNKQILKSIKKIKPKKIILLGDVLEMQYYSDRELQIKIYDLGLYNFLRTYKGKVIYVIGNHDINIENSRLSVLFQEACYNFEICEYYEDENFCFAHGHQYDTHIQKWGKIKYYLIYKIGDYLNLPKKIINWLIRKFK